MQVLLRKLFEPIPIQSLVFFRIAFGLILIWETVKHFQQGLIARYWIKPDYNFKYDWFTWVTPAPDNILYLLYALIGVAALLLSIGFFYRAAAAYLFLVTSYFFLLEETRYLNHTYLIIILSFLLIFLPLNKAFSIDAWLASKRKNWSMSNGVPRWVLILLQFQIGVPYFFGGIAKLQNDWFNAQPMKLWLAVRTDFPVIGFLFTKDWVAYFASYAGLALDLLAVPLLIYKRTRVFAFAALLAFHYLNANWFNIDIFPWLMIAATTLFLEPDWPEKLWLNLKSSKLHQFIYPASGVVFGFLALRMHEELNPVVFVVGFSAGLILVYLINQLFDRQTIETPKGKKKQKINTLVISLLCAWFSVQVLLPLRHFVIPGYSIWTEEGHRFAWHMLLRTKSGEVRYTVTQKDGQRSEVNPELKLESWQLSRFEDAPHLIHEYAKYLVKDQPDARVQAKTQVRLNGRDAQPIIDGSIDLAKESIVQWRADWILPLRMPLK